MPNPPVAVGSALDPEARSLNIQVMPAERASRVSRLADYPPVQGGASFDMSNVVEEFIEKALQ
jgi:hypothetical protein